MENKIIPKNSNIENVVLLEEDGIRYELLTDKHFDVAI